MIYHFIFLVIFLSSIKCDDNCLSNIAELKRATLNLFQNLTSAKIPQRIFQQISVTDDTWGDEKLTEEQCQYKKASMLKLSASIKNGNSRGRAAAIDFGRMPLEKWDVSKPIQIVLNTQFNMSTRIKQAISDIERVTCIRFKIITKLQAQKEKYFIQLKDVPGLGAGYSPVGRQFGGNVIELDSEGDKSMILHEMLHSLGFHHTQCRPDASQYLNFYWENMNPKFIYAFVPDFSISEVQGPFDFDSIMLYFSTAFSINGKPTMLPKKNPELYQNTMGMGNNLSEEDINALNRAYCDGKKGKTERIKCIDTNKNCKSLAKQCYAVDKMMIECRKTCGFCKDFEGQVAVCEDGLDNCLPYLWMCGNDLNVVHYKCKKSCGFCSTGVCQDVIDTETCQYYSNMCKNTTDAVHYGCRKTCGFCR